MAADSFFPSRFFPVFWFLRRAKREGTNSAGFRPCNFSFKVYFYVKLFLKTLADKKSSLMYSKIHRPRNPHICITYIIIIAIVDGINIHFFTPNSQSQWRLSYFIQFRLCAITGPWNNNSIQLHNRLHCQKDITPMSRIERSSKELLTNCLIRNFGRNDLKETANRNVKKK